MLTLFIESIKIKNPCQIKPQNLYDKDYQRFIKELGEIVADPCLLLRAAR